MRLGCVVEGHGEVTALPLLLRRLVHERLERIVDVGRPVRIPRSKLLKEGELERAVRLAWLAAGGGDARVLVLIDADDDCPKEMAPGLLARARQVHGPSAVGVVMATREYEAWLLAGARSLRGRRSLREDLEPPDHPEEIRDAKGWLDRHMSGRGRYSETVDQAALTAIVDLDAAARCRSFRKLMSDVGALTAE